MDGVWFRPIHRAPRRSCRRFSVGSRYCAGSPGIRSYKEEFIRILSGNMATDYECNLPKLRQDLCKLMKRGCPALDVVELMYGCTSGSHPTFSDAVRCVGLTERDLLKLRACCGWAADMISQFHESPIFKPLLSHPASLPEGLGPEQFRQKIEELPDNLRIFAKLLQNCPPVHSPWVEDFSKQPDFILLKLILKYFGCGYEILSRLLITMRRVRYNCLAPEGATLEEEEQSSFFGRPIGAGGASHQEIADAARTEMRPSRVAVGRAPDRGTSWFRYEHARTPGRYPGTGVAVFGLGPATRIYLAAGVTDMRKGFEGLYGLVRDRLSCDPLSGHLFLFCNAQRNRLKVLVWDGSGLWVCAKRLERALHLAAIRRCAGQSRLSHEELSLLLGGIDLAKTKHKRWLITVPPTGRQHRRRMARS